MDFPHKKQFFIDKKMRNTVPVKKSTMPGLTKLYTF
jgi:hypothetical protein